MSHPGSYSYQLCPKAVEVINESAGRTGTACRSLMASELAHSMAQENESKAPDNMSSRPISSLGELKHA